MADSQNSQPGLGRRAFLKITAFLGLWLGRPWLALAALTTKIPVRTKEKVTWTFDPATGELSGPGSLSGPYRLIVEGLVEKPLSLSYAELRALPQVEQVMTIRCHEGWKVPDVRWSGFRFNELIKRARPKPEAKFVVFYGLGEYRPGDTHDDRYFESFHLNKVLHHEADFLMVLDMEGQPLPLDHGAPLRVMAPNFPPHKSIKYVARIELTAVQELTRVNYTVHSRKPKSGYKMK